MGLCPTNCTPDPLVGLMNTTCTIDPRRDTPSRIFFFRCQTELPNPITPAGIKALFDSGDIVASSELTNFAFNAPNYEDVQLSDCRTPRRFISTREVTFEDRIKRVKPSSVSSPALDNDYADYDFWEDKLSNTESIFTMIAYCSGETFIPEDSNGNYMNSTLTGYKDFIRAGTAGGASTETKKFSLVYNDDPLAFNIKPSFNYIDAGIEL